MEPLVSSCENNFVASTAAVTKISLNSPSLLIAESVKNEESDSICSPLEGSPTKIGGMSESKP